MQLQPLWAEMIMRLETLVVLACAGVSFTLAQPSESVGDGNHLEDIEINTSNFPSATSLQHGLLQKIRQNPVGGEPSRSTGQSERPGSGERHMSAAVEQERATNL